MTALPARFLISSRRSNTSDEELRRLERAAQQGDAMARERLHGMRERDQGQTRFDITDAVRFKDFVKPVDYPMLASDHTRIIAEKLDNIGTGPGFWITGPAIGPRNGRIGHHRVYWGVMSLAGKDRGRFRAWSHPLAKRMAPVIEAALAAHRPRGSYVSHRALHLGIGRVKPVQNLGWLLRAASKNIIREIAVTPDSREGSDAFLRVEFEDGTLYETDFADRTVLWRFLDRPTFYGVPRTWFGVPMPVRKGQRYGTGRPGRTFQINPSGDDEIRALERAVAQGDRAAALRLDALLLRAGRRAPRVLRGLLKDVPYYVPPSRRRPNSGDEEMRRLERAVAEGDVMAADRVVATRRRHGQWDPSDPSNWIALAKVAGQHAEFVYILSRDGAPLFRVTSIEVTAPNGQKWADIRRSSHDFAARLHTVVIPTQGTTAYAGTGERIFPLYPGSAQDELTRLGARGAVGLGGHYLPGRMQEVEEIPGLEPLLRADYMRHTATYRADASGATPLPQFPRIIGPRVYRFRDLVIGQVFQFEHAQAPYGVRVSSPGAPYVKTGPRTYRSTVDPKRYGNMHPAASVMVIVPPSINPRGHRSRRGRAQANPPRALGAQEQLAQDITVWALGRLSREPVPVGMPRGGDRMFWAGEMLNHGHGRALSDEVKADVEAAVRARLTYRQWTWAPRQANPREPGHVRRARVARVAAARREGRCVECDAPAVAQDPYGGGPVCATHLQPDPSTVARHSWSGQRPCAACGQSFCERWFANPRKPRAAVVVVRVGDGYLRHPTIQAMRDTLENRESLARFHEQRGERVRFVSRNPLPLVAPIATGLVSGLAASVGSRIMNRSGNPRPPKGTPTSTNIYALARVFARSDGGDVPNQIESTSVPHIRRCLAAGLVEVSPDRRTLRLTDAGRGAIARDVKMILESDALRQAERERIAKLPPRGPLPDRIYFRVRIGSLFMGSPLHTTTDNHHLAASFDSRESAERAAATYGGQVEPYVLKMSNPRGRNPGSPVARALDVLLKASGDRDEVARIVCDWTYEAPEVGFHGIVPVRDIGTTTGRRAFAMRIASEEPLAKIARAYGPRVFGARSPRRPNVGPFIFAIGNGDGRPRPRPIRRPNEGGAYRVKLPADRVLGTMPLEEARRRWPNIGLDVQVEAFRDFNRGADPHPEVILWDDRRRGVEAAFIAAKVPEMVYGGPAGSPPGSFKDSGGVEGGTPEGTVWVHESPNEWMVGRAELDRDGRPVTRDFHLIGDTRAKTGWLRR